MQPITPVRAQSAPLLQSTPQARGTGSHTSPYEQVTQAEYAPYLREDLKFKRVIPLDTFLSQVFTTTPVDQHQNLVNEVASINAIQNRLKKYCEHTRHETHRYQPFVELVNDAMAALRKTIKVPGDLLFCRNDPTFVAGSYAERKPDVVGVRAAAFSDQARISPDNLSDKGPSEAPFGWHELLMFVEFKLVQAKIDYPQNAQTKLSCMQRSTLIRTARPDPCISLVFQVATAGSRAVVNKSESFSVLFMQPFS